MQKVVFSNSSGIRSWFFSQGLRGALALGLGVASPCFPALAQDKPLGVSGVEKENFSKTLRPSDDFFRYVNENWLESTDIPPDQSNYGSFTALDIETKGAIRAIIEEASKSAIATPEAKQVGDFFKSYTDIEARNRAGITPVKPWLETIQAIRTQEDAIRVAGELSIYGIPSFFSAGIDVDDRRSDQYAVYLYQDGTTLPDRDYYLDSDPELVSRREKYEVYIKDMLGKIGWEKPDVLASEILKLETVFAKVQWDKVSLRDPIKRYNKTSVVDFSSKNQGVRWKTYAQAVGIPDVQEIIVGQPSFFEQAQEILAKTDPEVLKAYLAFQTIDTFAPVMTEELEKLHFGFHKTVLSGVEQQEPLWRRGVDACNSLLGMPVGKLYVQKHFSPKAKERMNELVGNLLKAFEKRIDSLEWMGNGTKAQAKEKLKLFTPKIGYPDKWKDYSSVQIDPSDIVSNIGRISKFEHFYALNKLGKPIDKTEWFMPPQTVNAYYNPSMNEIVFPAAILQPPFFNLQADDAINYGAIGAVIGHEISHGFDDSGSKYDGRGNLRNWWTENDEKEFVKRSEQLISQYDTYQPLPGINLNGKFTLGENIGDLGGLSVAYTAYKLSLGQAKSPVIDGYTGEQRFFIGWGQVWRRKYREAEMRKRIKTDPHSPSQYRCNGIVSNLDSYYEAFGVEPGSPMYIEPQKRVRIW
jgi:endothelin-converting enzyme/putative endopeptidase